MQQSLKKLQTSLVPTPQPFVLDLLSGMFIVIMELRGRVSSRNEIE